MRCKCCGGSKKMIGGGSIIVDCSLCTNLDEEVIEEISDKKPIKIHQENITIDKRSKSYRDAIKKIMAVDATLSRKEAMDLFDSTASQ